MTSQDNLKNNDKPITHECGNKECIKHVNIYKVNLIVMVVVKMNLHICYQQQADIVISILIFIHIIFLLNA